MKKYPKLSNKWYNRTNVISFIFAWNAFGICVYQWYKKEDKIDKEGTRLSFIQRYMKTIMHHDESKKIHHYRMSGVGTKEFKETTLAEFTKTKKEEIDKSKSDLNDSTNVGESS